MSFCSVCQDENAEHTEQQCPEQKCKTCGAWGHIFRNCPQKIQKQVPVSTPEIPVATKSEKQPKEPQKMLVTPKKCVESTNISYMPGPSVAKNEPIEYKHSVKPEVELEEFVIESSLLNDIASKNSNGKFF